MLSIPMPETDLPEVLAYYDELMSRPANCFGYEVINLVLDFLRVSENELSDEECLDYLANLLEHWSKG